jgi:hypothetical protein
MKRIELIQKAAMEYASYKTQDKGIAYLDFVRAVEWADRTMIEKACELLEKMIEEVTYYDVLEGGFVQHYDKMEFIEDFRKAMEE